VGARNVFRDQLEAQVRELKIESQVTLAGYVSDAELIQLYQTSHALVQPSFSEGFGLTGIEAMASGTLVLASDIPIFKEIYQTAAIYFNPHSVSNFVIAAQSVQALSVAKRRDRLKAALTLVQNYDWRVMAQKTWETYLSTQAA
jgi:glycosyltransferase involved in cell wall biosynthesis